MYAKVPQHFSPCIFSAGMLLTMTTHTHFISFDNVPAPPGWPWVQMEGRICPPARTHPHPRLSQLFSNKVIQRGGGQGGCSISTGYMRFEICILLCHFCLFWRFSNKMDEMSPFIWTPPWLAGLCQNVAIHCVTSNPTCCVFGKVWRLGLNNQGLWILGFRISKNTLIGFIFL